MDIGNNEGLNYSRQMLPKSQFGRANVMVDEIEMRILNLIIIGQIQWAGRGNGKIQMIDITGVIY